MIITGVDGREYTWNIYKYSKQQETCSKYHKRARFLLKSLFPMDIVYEEVYLPGTKDGRQERCLVADFYIHTESLVIEVQGEQHYKFNSFFYKNKLEFFKAQARDRLKQLWCDTNNIILIALPYCESDDEWTQHILNRYDNE